MSAQAGVDVLAVMERELRCLAPYQPKAAEEMLEARAAVAELIAAAGDYFTGWCQDEADSPNDGIGPVCGPEQHKAAVRLRAALLRVTAP